MTTPTNPATVFANLTADREKRIADYIALHSTEDHKIERWEACMGVDVEAPETTNWEMLKMIGIDPDTADLYTIIDGLACWHIFLSNTNHLDDAQLLAHIKTRVLMDTVTLIPPNRDMHECIELINDNLPEIADRDAHLPRPLPRPATATN